jgi:putative peptidoglycan lipid II flippase
MNKLNHSAHDDEKSPSIIGSAAAMSVATLSSRILGMLRDMVIAAFFTRMVSDAFVVAFRLPNLFRRILGEGSLSASFVPLYIENLNRNPEEAKAFSNAVFSMLAALTATLSVLGTIYMPWVMSHLVSGDGYMQVDGKYELTVFLARIMFSYLFLVTTYAFFMSIANAHKVFFIPALAPAAFNLVEIVFAFMPEWKMHGDQLAWGVIAGGFIQMTMAAWPLRKLRVLPRWSVRWSGPNVSAFFRTVLPSMLGMSVAQLLGLLNVNFASRLEQGTHSYIYFADRLLEFPQSLLSVSLGVALLPTLSELWVRGEKTQFLQTTQRHIRLLLVMSLPAAVGLFILAEPIVRVIFGRGQFSPHDVSQTAQVVSIYALILMTWLPAANSVFCLCLHYFVADWATTQYGLQGLVAATAFTGALNLLILIISFRIIFGELGVFSFMRAFIWLVPSLVCMGAFAYYVESVTRESLQRIFSISPMAAGVVALGLAILAAISVFISINRAVRHPEANELINMIQRRIKK